MMIELIYCRQLHHKKNINYSNYIYIETQGSIIDKHIFKKNKK